MVSILQKYREFLPLKGMVDTVDLGEGNTPLIRSTGLDHHSSLFFKLEYLNPTGSFKDRFAAVETALLRDSGAKSFIATSSGNTGSALAAYAAKHGLQCLLFVNEIAPGNKLKQIVAYGARVFRVKGFGVSNVASADIFNRLQKLAEQKQSRLSVSAFKYSADGMAGIKTIAYELVEQLGESPDQIFVPVGGGGLLTGILRGFLDMRARTLIHRIPRVNAVQPVLNDTIVSSLLNGDDKAREVTTTTGISGLAVQVDIDATSALQAVRASGGHGYLVTDDEIRETQKQLCLREGIFVEPAGAASVAGYSKAVASGLVLKDETVVCILTGHGLKDMSDEPDFESAIENITPADINRHLEQV